MTSAPKTFAKPQAPKFSAKQFYDFCNNLRVDTKEYGIVPLGSRLYGAQKEVVSRIEQGLAKGIHSFVVLKGRQMGISTLSLAFDLFWAFKYPGTQGSLVTNDDGNRDMFRNTLNMYIEGLPAAWKVPVKINNRFELGFRNRSRFLYQVAGERKNSSLGKGKALNFLHATEVSAWGDEEALASLQAALAEQHPLRLYLYESTAQGFNLFHQMWETAKRSVAQDAIFVGWWLKEDYRVKEDSPIYKVYGYKGMSDYERKAVRMVNKLYGHTMTQGQLAWYRWKLNDEIKDDNLMRQNFPMHEEEAFILSGSNFFSTDILTDLHKALLRGKPRAHFSFRFRDRFEDTDVQEAHPKNATLRIWEFPKPGAVYVLGADPAYGASQNNDRSCAQVWRCYADKVEQVAEFCSPLTDTYQFAYICAYLSGVYGPASRAMSMMNLEINGPGQAVKAELNNMRRNVADAGGVSGEIRDFIGNIRSYLYRRVDAVSKNYVLDWKTNADSKERMMNALNDAVSRDQSVIRSAEMVEEMRTVIREEGSITHASHTHDDRVVASALAVVAWHDFMRAEAAKAGQFWAEQKMLEDPEQAFQRGPDTGQQLIRAYLGRAGLR